MAKLLLEFPLPTVARAAADTILSAAAKRMLTLEDQFLLVIKDKMQGCLGGDCIAARPFSSASRTGAGTRWLRAPPPPSAGESSVGFYSCYLSGCCLRPCKLRGGCGLCWGGTSGEALSPLMLKSFTLYPRVT